MEDWSDRTALIAVQGPRSEETLQKLTDTDLSSIKFYSFTKGSMAGVDDVVISHTGYTGEKGFELYFDNAHATGMWDAIMDAGEEYGIKPAGLAARDTLRLEVGLCLYGNDIDDSTSPIEARLGWITKFTKGFVNADALKEQKEAGVSRKLMGFKLLDKGIPRKGYQILNESGKVIGEVTSGTMSPVLKEPIGLGYLDVQYSEPGNDIKVAIRKKEVPAQVVKPPFIEKK